MILFLHNRYRTTGGEERAVDDLLWLTREALGEDAELLTRDSAALGAPRAAVALLRGGLHPDDISAAVRRTRARIIYAHNLLPAFGWRGLAAGRAAGARVLAHLHNYRLVCAVGTCFTHDGDCLRCHGRNTLPGVRLNCRGTGPEAAVYGASLALWQERLVRQADAFVVPSAFAQRRLEQLGAPLHARVHVVPGLVRTIADGPRFAAAGPAVVASRLAREKGVDVAIEACREAGLPLVVAGDGPLRGALERSAQGADVRFAGRLPAPELDALRAGASVELVPSRAAETFGLAAAEAMAGGLPVVASRTGALGELVPLAQLAPPGDPAALARLALTHRGQQGTAIAGLAAVRAVAAPAVVAQALGSAYAALT